MKEANFENIIHLLSIREFSIEYLEVPSHQIGIWQKEGVIDKFNSERTVKFNLVEILWISIIQDLKERFGQSYETIRQVKERLFVDF